MTNPAFGSPCGLYCGVCAIRIAHQEQNEKFKERLVSLYKGEIPGKGTLPNCENLTTKDIYCDGCLSENRFMHCQQCDIRECALARGISGCHHCDDFPCRFIEEFPMAVGKKVMPRCTPLRREIGTRQWMQDEEDRYFCPECGHKVFRGVVRCNRCKAGLSLD
ncbi:MAG: DUF3795 domain-containing protein [Desulfotignum sp.]